MSVVVPTLNGRDAVGDCLDALAERLPDAEVVVVNGPSTDGTSGFVRGHPATDLLIEVPERNLNVARNAGLSAAAGDVLALLGQGSVPDDSWFDAVTETLADGASAVTGPVHRAVEGGVTTETVESRTVAGRAVTFFDGGNVAFTDRAVEMLDGFDEYLETGAARDAAHRLAGLEGDVTWQPKASVLRAEVDDVADRTAREVDGPLWDVKHRSLAYRLAKNYGPRPAVGRLICRRAAGDARTELCRVRDGEETPTGWLASGRSVATNLLAGTAAGLRARLADRTPRRNPNGISSRMDRAVARVRP